MIYIRAEPMNPVNVDRDMLTTYLEEDSDYQEHPYRVYLNRGNGELLSIYEDEEEVENMFGLSAEETRNLRREVENNPEVYLEFPVPGHAQWHEWFQEFLEQRDRSEEYFGSIGGWIKQYASEEDYRDWENFKPSCVVRYAIEIATAAGVKIKIV
ncbi:MAG: hypothetical protein V3U04_07930 [Candidatus Aerophobetes bacterium]